MIAVSGEQRQLGAGRGLHSADDDPHRLGIGLSPEMGVLDLSHVGGALHPVGYGPPVALRYGLDQMVQAGGDGESDTRLAADGDHGVGVETAVGSDGELSGGPGRSVPVPASP